MTDAHFHRNGYPAFLRAPDRETRFYGIHPWQADEIPDFSALRAQLAADPSSGVGEIGLDRLKSKTISDSQRELFEKQLALAAELRRPVVLHGAKCWGEVVAACLQHKGRIPAFLFHGFSRSAGLLPEIFAINGYVSVGPALLNDHAVNYRELVKTLPPDRILIETDMDYAVPETKADETLRLIAATLAALRGEDAGTTEAQVAENIRAFAQVSRSS
ncbi:MAG: TatD family hydrolase [Kiritimatiellae bacterium]|nr:TatD family hydrolase [Kiritimatiellia bacterium]